MAHSTHFRPSFINSTSSTLSVHKMQLQKRIQRFLESENRKPMKAQLGLSDLSTIGIIFVVLAVVLSIGAYILLSIGNTGLFPTNSVANTTLSQGQTALKTFATWLPILAVVVVAGVVIYILVSMFHGNARGSV